jgi:hypothetical protein
MDGLEANAVRRVVPAVGKVALVTVIWAKAAEQAVSATRMAVNKRRKAAKLVNVKPMIYAINVLLFNN